MMDHNWNYPRDLPEAAMGLLANVEGHQTEEWKLAAQTWIDAYHEHLNSLLHPEAEYVDPDRLLVDGTVLLVNLAVLWPRGMALTVDQDHSTGEAFLGIQDFGEYNAMSNRHHLLARFEALLDAEDERERRASGRTDA